MKKKPYIFTFKVKLYLLLISVTIKKSSILCFPYFKVLNHNSLNKLPNKSICIHNLIKWHEVFISSTFGQHKSTHSHTPSMSMEKGSSY